MATDAPCEKRLISSWSTIMCATDFAKYLNNWEPARDAEVRRSGEVFEVWAYPLRLPFIV